MHVVWKWFSSSLPSSQWWWGCRKVSGAFRDFFHIIIVSSVVCEWFSNGVNIVEVVQHIPGVVFENLRMACVCLEFRRSSSSQLWE